MQVGQRGLDFDGRIVELVEGSAKRAKVVLESTGGLGVRGSTGLNLVHLGLSWIFPNPAGCTPALPANGRISFEGNELLGSQ